MNSEVDKHQQFLLWKKLATAALRHRALFIGFSSRNLRVSVSPWLEKVKVRTAG
jgi:hypothetical protein